MEKTNQRIMLTKKLLKDGLLRLLENKSIEKVNVTELCREAGINRATFYAHYETPHDVLNEIESDISADVIHSFEQVLQNDKHLNLQEGIEIVCQYFYDNIELLRVLIRNYSTQNLAISFTRAYEAVISSPLAKGADEEDVKLVTTFLAGGGFFVLCYWISGGVQKTSKEMAQLMADLLSGKMLMQ